MAVVQTLIGNVKGPAGATGATGATGDPGAAATITVGSTTTTAYGNAASVTNSGTSSAAVFDFVIPQGKPGEATTKMGDLLLDSITSSAADFPSPQVGDTGKTAFGKINKFSSDVLSVFTQHESDMATISTSPTTQAFSRGDYLVYNRQLYRVTQNIANGSNLVVGTNIATVTVGSEFNQTLIMQSTLPANTDLNSVTNVGIYALIGSNTYTNMPSGVGYGVLTVQRGNTTASVLYQILSTSGADLYMRGSNNSGSSWNAWRRVYNTVSDYVDNSTSAIAGTSVTVNRIYNYTHCGMGFAAGSITTSASISSSADVLTGLTGAVGTVDFVMASTGGAGYAANIRSGGNIRFGQSTPAGTYVFNFTYPLT